MSSFKKLLITYKIHSGNYNYISMNEPKGKFNIPDNKLEEFLIKYHDCVFNTKEKCHILERPCEYSSLKIDIDFKYTDSKKRIYTNTHIDNLCKLYMKHIEEYISFNNENNDRLCFITEKKKPTKEKNNMKDGVHILFPYIICKPEFEYLIREKVIAELNTAVFNDIKYINSPEDVVDKSIIKTGNWFLYGGSKEPKKESYLLTRVLKCYSNNVEVYGYPEEMKKEINDERYKYYNSLDLIKLLSIKNYNNIEPVLIKDEKFNDIEKIKLKYNLISDNNMKINNEHEDNSSENSEIDQRCTKQPIFRPGRTAKKSCSNKNIIKLLVGCLSKERATAHNSWINVGWTLFNIHNTDSSLLDSWMEWSKTGNGYENQSEPDRDSMKLLWSKMKNKNLGEGSLRLWAKQDNEKKYGQVLYQENKEAIIASIQSDIYSIDKLDELSKELKKMQISAITIANLLYNMYKDEFKIVDTKGKGTYYHFTEHRWSLMCDNTLLRKKIIDIEQRYLEYLEYLHNMKDTEKQQLNYNKDHQDKIIKTIGKLNSTSFKENIMTESKDVFYKAKEGRLFLDNLDSNIYLIGFENGIYDLRDVGKKDGQVIVNPFRNGVPEDMVTLSTGINYIPYDEIEGTDEEREIYEFLDQIFVKREIREYVMTHLASVLCGSTKNERFHFWSGSGGNGKSKIIELLGMCLGDYYCNLPVTLLTQKRSKSNEASPDLAITQGKRFAVLQEPEGNSQINAGILKEMTGGDKITAREFYKMPVTFKPQFKLVLTCNEKPNLNQHDGGIWRRVRLIEFESRFMNKPDNNNPYHFKIDYELSEKFEDWKEPFMSILLNKYYKIYKEKGLVEPKQVLEFTQNYKDDPCEHYNKFVKDCIVKQDGEKLKMGDAWATYMKWLDEEGKSKGARSLFMEYMDKKFGNIRPWQDITILTYQEEDEDDM